MVLSLPVFTLKGGDEFNWDRVILEWIRILPFLLIFIINNSLLAPKLFFKQKLIGYSISILTIVILFSVFNNLPQILHDFLFQGPGPERIPMHPEGPMSPDSMGAFPEPPPFGRHSQLRGNKPFSYLIFENMIISFLVVGFNNAIKLGISRQKEELQREEKEKIHLETELSFLRTQISPHFFMNTLNNIHALIEIDQVQAQKSVIELSKLMRYLLNESQQGTATIRAEFEFLNSYIDLMRIRYSDKVKIDVNFEIPDDHQKIPSLLFISLVENAFKYGISYSKESYISIHAKQDQEQLSFEIKNSVSPKSKIEKGTGVGLVNLRKQLDILFDGEQSFDIIESENEYQVKLIIPLKND
ncbi:sensor histidine kinase [Labilibaculum antarcticum]|uniref:Sensor histidine kinase n=2 Tax=Labilibaculum antarcticum TaxID=1717717 RepID=A0A1Y1CNK2_9BACT|nr:sensor histidine kinase [Labilibaculum antarcticum]